MNQFLAKYLISILVGVVVIPTFVSNPSPAFGGTQTDHIILVVLEGIGNEQIQSGELPVLQRLAKEGAVTWSAKSITPSLSVPAMASLLTGLPVERHRINKEWEHYDFSRSFMRSPTMFDYMDLAGGQDTALFLMDERFYQLARPEIYVDTQTCGTAKPHCNPATLTVYIRDYLKKVTSQGGYGFRLFEVPGLLVAHLPAAAHVGKKRGWDSKRYHQALESVDNAVQEIINIYSDLGVLDNTMVMVIGLNGPGQDVQTASSAGHDMSTVPWFVWGANIKSGYSMTNSVSILDTGATVMEALGLETHTEWESHAHHEIFQVVPKRRTTGNESFNES